MSALSVIEVFAGSRPDGSPVVERLQVKESDDGLVLTRSPAFIKGVAKGDLIAFNEEDHSFELKQRAGNVCVRVMGRHGIAELSEDLTPEIEKAGGELDVETDRMLVYSIHVSCGFQKIEKILNDYIDEDEEQLWLYGNVYDPKDGVTPLNWWQDILKPQ